MTTTSVFSKDPGSLSYVAFVHSILYDGSLGPRPSLKGRGSGNIPIVDLFRLAAS